MPPLAIGRVPVTPVVRGKPVQLVSVPEAGVPRTGAVKVGDVSVLLDSVWESDVPTMAPVGASTLVNAPVPLAMTTPAVSVATPVPPFATGRIPVTPVVSGKPVQLVSVPDDGVPRTGAVKVGDVSVLLVSVWVAVVPTRSPAGFATVENVVVPLACRIPAENVPAPVPPLATEIGDEKVVPLPITLLVSVWESDVPTTAPVGASTLVNAPVPFDLTIPVASVDTPVPPEATGNVPERVPLRSMVFHDGAAEPFAVSTRPAVPAASIAVAPAADW